jgi:NTP pyrophosphatase (non-canonical NTP hydrolase)
MKFSDFQEDIQQTLVYRDKIKSMLVAHGSVPTPSVVTLLGLSYAALGLGESGEVQGKVKKIIRDSGGIITEEHRQKIASELGDTLWYVAAVASELGLDLDAVAQGNIDKLLDRRNRGVICGSGDDR